MRTINCYERNKPAIFSAKFHKWGHDMNTLTRNDFIMENSLQFASSGKILL